MRWVERIFCPALAAALAAEIDTEAPGAVIELGPGTGRVTAYTLVRGMMLRLLSGLNG